MELEQFEYFSNSTGSERTNLPGVDRQTREREIHWNRLTPGTGLKEGCELSGAVSYTPFDWDGFTFVNRLLLGISPPSLLSMTHCDLSDFWKRRKSVAVKTVQYVKWKLSSCMKWLQRAIKNVSNCRRAVLSLQPLLAGGGRLATLSGSASVFWYNKQSRRAWAEKKRQFHFLPRLVRRKMVRSWCLRKKASPTTTTH